MEVVGNWVVPELMGASEGGVDGKVGAWDMGVRSADGMLAVSVADNGGESKARWGVASDVVNGKAQVEGKDGAVEKGMVLVKSAAFLEGGSGGGDEPLGVEDEEFGEEAWVGLPPDDVYDPQDGAAMESGEAVVMKLAERAGSLVAAHAGGGAPVIGDCSEEGNGDRGGKVGEGEGEGGHEGGDGAASVDDPVTGPMLDASRESGMDGLAGENVVMAVLGDLSLDVEAWAFGRAGRVRVDGLGVQLGDGDDRVGIGSEGVLHGVPDVEEG